jgi:hypothetical protein
MSILYIVFIQDFHSNILPKKVANTQSVRTGGKYLIFATLTLC